MSTVKISELPVLVSPDPADEFVVVDDSAGVTKKTTGVYNQANVVGTVSESGGDVTGAVIERDENANGEYVKFADGTMIAFRLFTLSSVSITSSADVPSGWARSLNQAFNYPVTFISVPTFTAVVSRGDGDFDPSVYVHPNQLGTSSGNFNFIDPRGNDTIDVSVSYIAIGRWY